MGPSDPAGDAPCPGCGNLLWFLRKPVGEAVVLTFLPGLMVGSEALQRINEVTAAAGDLSRVVLDFRCLRFITSLFLGMLVTLHRRAVVAGGTLKLCGLRPEIREVFQATKLDAVFAIYDDQQSALASF